MGLNQTNFDENDHYGTPQRVWGPIIKYFGKIDLDPFWNPYSTVPSVRKWTDWKMPKSWRSEFNEDGVDSFARSWDGFGLVYINGPFSQTGDYVRKAATEGDEVIVLVKANDNAIYWHDYVRPADRLLNFRGRLMFDRPPGAKIEQAPFHCQLAYWGVRAELFDRAFSDEGMLYQEYVPPWKKTNSLTSVG